MVSEFCSAVQQQSKTKAAQHERPNTCLDNHGVTTDSEDIPENLGIWNCNNKRKLLCFFPQK